MHHSYNQIITLFLFSECNDLVFIKIFLPAPGELFLDLTIHSFKQNFELANSVTGLTKSNSVSLVETESPGD